MSSTDATPHPAHPWRRWLLGLGAAFLLAAGALVAAEVAGWPFLGAPLERWLSNKLDRRVELGSSSGGFRVHFLGSLRMQAPTLFVAAPAWSKTPHLLSARDAELELRYADLWQAWRGQPLRVHSLQAASADAHAERLADGRASWQFDSLQAPDTAASAPATPPPRLARLLVRQGALHYSDIPLAAEVQAKLTLDDGPAAAGGKPILRLNATGQYQKLPLKVDLKSNGVLPWLADDAEADPVEVKLSATIGRASLSFDGSATDAVHLGGVRGHFRVQGPSLSAVGDPLRVTLPTTAPFSAEGELSRNGHTWLVQVADATIGSSRLRGTFAYQAGPGMPMLTGQLSGQRLMLADLGPVVGTTPKVPEAAAPKPAADATPKLAGKVLPTREFDLAALRAMDADVRVDIAEVNLNTSYLEPLRPLRGHLLLTGGILTLSELDARTAQGKLSGMLRLDGRATSALWNTDLRWSDVQLDRWLHLERKEGAPAWITGQLDGTAVLQGKGRSTAEILGSLNGRLRTELRNGTVSHLAVEAAGLDVAQGLGLLIKGDDALPVHCAVADLQAQDGLFKPRTLVLDTSDSVLWLDGSLSLATESMDLRVVVTPKDFSPLALRTPLLVRGPFAQPAVSLDKKPLATKVGTALLLGLLNPLAALIPFVDVGDSKAAPAGNVGCAALVRSASARAASVR